MASSRALVAYNESQLAKMIESLYPGTDELTKRAAVVIGARYALDPLLRELQVIEFGSEKGKDGNWIKKYGVYIGLAGMETIANRSGIPWNIQIDTPRPMVNPYSQQNDVWLQGTLYRAGHPPLTDGRWFSEVVRLKSDGTPNNFWRTKPSEMHRKCVRLYLLRRGFSVGGAELVDDKTFSDGAEAEQDYIDPLRTPDELVGFIQERVMEHYHAGRRGPMQPGETAYLLANFDPLENHEVLLDKALMKRGRALERPEALAIVDWLRGSPDPQGELSALAEWARGERPPAPVDQDAAKQAAMDVFG